jgi:hypothetical protein
VISKLPVLDLLQALAVGAYNLFSQFDLLMSCRLKTFFVDHVKAVRRDEHQFQALLFLIGSEGSRAMRAFIILLSRYLFLLFIIFILSLGGLLKNILENLA